MMRLNFYCFGEPHSQSWQPCQDSSFLGIKIEDHISNPKPRQESNRLAHHSYSSFTFNIYVFFIFLSQEIGAHCFLTKCSDNGVSRSEKIVMNDFFKIKIFIYLLLAVLGLHCYIHFSQVLASRGFFLPEMHGLLMC